VEGRESMGRNASLISTTAKRSFEDKCVPKCNLGTRKRIKESVKNVAQAVSTENPGNS
jgi:hypothetical protein